MTGANPWDPSAYDQEANLEIDPEPLYEDETLKGSEWDLSANVTRCVIACHKNEVIIHQPKCILPKVPDFTKTQTSDGMYTHCTCERHSEMYYPVLQSRRQATHAKTFQI